MGKVNNLVLGSDSMSFSSHTRDLWFHVTFGNGAPSYLTAKEIAQGTSLAPGNYVNGFYVDELEMNFSNNKTVVKVHLTL